MEKIVKKLNESLDISKCVYCTFTCKSSELKEHPELMGEHIMEHCKDHPVFKCFKRMEELEVKCYCYEKALNGK